MMKKIVGNKKRMVKVGIGLLLLPLCFIAGIYFISFLLGPPKLDIEQNTVLLSTDGEVIGVESGLENRAWISLDEMAPEVIEATLLTEDQHFFEHNGFDFKRIAGAVLQNIRSMSLKEGASTLTQQYARNLYLTHEKTWIRKIKEAFYTVRLEMFYSKDEILEGYLNTIYYGHGAYGIEAASNYFFDKPASDLTLAESAMLAAVPKGPSYYSPLNDAENAKQRQTQILTTMYEEDAITETQYQDALAMKLVYAGEEEEDEEKIGPYLQDAALNEVAAILELDPEEIRSGGYEIYTTMQVERQKALERELMQTLHTAGEIDAGVMAMDPTNGAIRALAGGTDYRESPFNRATQAKRMPGSTFKPFLYYAALENGYTPTTMLMSKPTTFELADGEVYQPSNFNGYYAGEPITLAQAIALSDNVYAVKTNMALGAEQLVETARKFGFSGKLPAVPSLALGTATVSVEEMVAGYAMLANGGREVEGYTVERIVDRNGKTVFEREKEQDQQVLDEQSAFILTHLLTGIFDRELNGYMPVTGSPIADQLTRIYAGKSGTTASDSWMIGYSPSLVTGVWIGYDDNRDLPVGVSSFAKNIWAGFMEKAHAGLPQEKFDVPDGVVGVPVDPDTGKRATPFCGSSRVMYFEEGNEPIAYCSMHDVERGDEQGGGLGIFERWFELFF
nr:PBP1A family penicillin-binding protein [Lentibacillus sediminis]